MVAIQRRYFQVCYKPIVQDILRAIIFSQWIHTQGIEKLHYARWKTGEVDIVLVNIANQKPSGCVEVKWSNLLCSDTTKLKGLFEFLKKNNMEQAVVTTRTITQKRVIDDMTIDFQPSSVYTYSLGNKV
jgi:hypothetical protein